MNLSSNFLKGSFSNRNSVIPPIQFQRKRQSHHLYKMIFYEGPYPSIFTPIAWVKAISYYSSWCLQDQIQVQKRTWAVAIGKIICIYQEGGPTDHQHWQGILVKPSHQKPPKTVFDKKIKKYGENPNWNFQKTRVCEEEYIPYIKCHCLRGTTHINSPHNSIFLSPAWLPQGQL